MLVARSTMVVLIAISGVAAAMSSSDAQDLPDGRFSFFSRPRSGTFRARMAGVTDELRGTFRIDRGRDQVRIECESPRQFVVSMRGDTVNYSEPALGIEHRGSRSEYRFLDVLLGSPLSEYAASEPEAPSPSLRRVHRSGTFDILALQAPTSALPIERVVWREPNQGTGRGGVDRVLVFSRRGFQLQVELRYQYGA